MDLPHYGFETFDEVTALLARWLDANAVPAAQEPARAADE
jgi:hypothetical protein